MRCDDGANVTDVEMTGGHTQFWGKLCAHCRANDCRQVQFPSRHEPHYQEHVVQPTSPRGLREIFSVRRRASEEFANDSDDRDQFIKFVNMLMSDTTFHLEESLTSLTKIHSLRAEKEDTEAWARLTEAEQTDLDSQLKQAESVAPYHTSMGRDHIELMRDFTATTKEPFLAGEIVDRLAAVSSRNSGYTDVQSLDENLTNLVGPKMQELKLVDPERFSFKPKQLLAGIAQIYLNLGDSLEFIGAVANDGRSYSKELFERFARVLKNRAIMTDGEVAGIVALAQRVEDRKATNDAEDQRSIPDEFLGES